MGTGASDRSLGYSHINPGSKAGSAFDAAACRGRDSTAMQVVDDRVMRRTLGIANRILNDRSQAEELLVDVFFEYLAEGSPF